MPWRYENAINLAAPRDLGSRELLEQVDRDRKEQAVILQLRSAKKELEDTGEISQETKQRTFSLMPGGEGLWLALEETFHGRLEQMGLSKGFQKLSPQMRSRTLAMSAVTNAISLLEQLRHRKLTNEKEVAIGQHAVPNHEALGRLLRYETTIDRSLTRALDRLERLQRRRGSERIRQETDRIQ